MDRAPRVTLSNGVTVVNFSSKRRIHFEDGTILEGCSERRSTSLLCVPDEKEALGPKGSAAVILNYKVTDRLINELSSLEADPTVDWIMVPMPVISALATRNHTFEKVCKIGTSIDKFYR